VTVRAPLLYAFGALENVRQISVGDLAALAERWNLEHGANFYFLFFSAFWGRIEKY